MSKKLAIIGASGHGKVIADIALKNGYEIVGFLDDNDAVKEIAGFPVLGSVSEIPSYQTECEFIIAIGNNRIREMIAEQYAVNWATLIHPTAVIGMDVQIEVGTVVMANAVINPSARIGKHCIINTGAVIEMIISCRITYMCHRMQRLPERFMSESEYMWVWGPA